MGWRGLSITSGNTGSITCNMPNSIPQTDPKANYLAHKAEIDAAIAAVLESGRYILGREVEAFEREFAEYLGVAHVVGVGSGTDALHLALRACGVGPGDEVVTVSHTAVATVAAIELAGAIPVLVDIDPATFTIDCTCLEDLLRGPRSARVKAIVPVHLYGHPANMPAVIEIASRHGLEVIEDCAQSHGANLRGRKTGTWGRMAAFSFYPTKNLGALGDGGAVVTNDPALAQRTRERREYGWRDRYVSASPGMNSRLDELQAAILRVKLRHLDCDNARRRELADAYGAVLAGSDLVLPQCQTEALHVYHQYVVRSAQRDALRARLRDQGIGTLIHYPVPVHLQPAYRDRIQHGLMARTKDAANEVLSLPMYPELSLEQVKMLGSIATERAAR
jgi:dTDP-4-amino-4,6-dideoxygalactose transaminase